MKEDISVERAESSIESREDCNAAPKRVESAWPPTRKWILVKKQTGWPCRNAPASRFLSSLQDWVDRPPRARSGFGRKRGRLPSRTQKDELEGSWGRRSCGWRTLGPALLRGALLGGALLGAFPARPLLSRLLGALPLGGAFLGRLLSGLSLFCHRMWLLP